MLFNVLRALRLLKQGWDLGQGMEYEREGLWKGNSIPRENPGKPE